MDNTILFSPHFNKTKQKKQTQRKKYPTKACHGDFLNAICETGLERVFYSREPHGKWMHNYTMGEIWSRMLFETVLKQGGWQLGAAVTCLSQGSNSKQERKKSAIITVLSLLIYIWLYRLQLFCMRSCSFNIIREQRRNGLQLSVINKQQLPEDVSVALAGTVRKTGGLFLCREAHRRKKKDAQDSFNRRAPSC